MHPLPDPERCALCGWRIDDTGDHSPSPDPLGLVGDVCVWCWKARAQPEHLAELERREDYPPVPGADSLCDYGY